MYNQLSDDFLERKIITPRIGVIIPNIDVYLNDDGTNCFYILKRNNDIIGHIWLQHIIDDIYQVKESSIKTPNQGIGSEIYHFIIKFGGIKDGEKIPLKKLIHDTQLPVSAEHIWNEKLKNRGITMKIYDKCLNKIYNISDVGKLTSDNIRFFILAECHKQPVLSERDNQWLKIHQKFLLNECSEQELIDDIIKHKFSPNIILGGKSWI